MSQKYDLKEKNNDFKSKPIKKCEPIIRVCKGNEEFEYLASFFPTNDSIDAVYGYLNREIIFTRDTTEQDILCIISHEILHHILYQEIGYQAARELDNIDCTGWSFYET